MSQCIGIPVITCQTHLIEQRQAICAAEVECRIVSELNNQQWQLAEKVVNVLKPFEEAIEAVSSILCCTHNSSCQFTCAFLRYYS